MVGDNMRTVRKIMFLWQAVRRQRRKKGGGRCGRHFFLLKYCFTVNNHVFSKSCPAAAAGKREGGGWQVWKAFLSTIVLFCSQLKYKTICKHVLQRNKRSLLIEQQHLRKAGSQSETTIRSKSSTINKTLIKNRETLTPTVIVFLYPKHYL